MPKVRVWNDNEHPYKETFKGDAIEIPAKAHILMDLEDAEQFRGTYAPPIRGADGMPDRRGFKMIRIERIAGEVVDTKPPTSFICNACRYSAANASDLNEHIQANHADAIVTDETAEAELPTVAAAARGPGRPGRKPAVPKFD